MTSPEGESGSALRTIAAGAGCLLVGLVGLALLGVPSAVVFWWVGMSGIGAVVLAGAGTLIVIAVLFGVVAAFAGD